MNWAFLLAAVFIPQASTRTLHDAPLAKGETAYVESETPGYARLYVGGDNGAALRVEDGATVHGYQYEYIDRTKVTIVAGEGLTYNGGLDKYTAATNTTSYVLQVMVSPDIEIETLEYTAVAAYNDMIDISNGTITHTINGNVATITMTREDPRGEMSVAGIKVRRVLAGVKDQVNDLTKLEFTMLDDLGEYSWRSLRYWVAHLYDYNRGEDWARYKAKQRANLNGNGLQLSANNRFAIDVTETQTVFRAAAHDAIVVKATGTGAGYDGAFTAYGPRPTATGVDIPFSCDITGFDASQLSVSGCVSIATLEWAACPATLDAGVLHVTCSADTRFFKVYYNGAIVDTCEVVVNAPIRLNDALYLKGEDSVVYRITVNAGVISATPVN
jgi:hypothetical protein